MTAAEVWAVAAVVMVAAAAEVMTQFTR